jgi:beta-glucosidase
MSNRTYRYLNETPLYPFGYGLSYSSFSYSDPIIAQSESASAAPSAPGDSPVKISVQVTNTSSTPGDEVVELYISHPQIEGAPIRALAGFQRIHLDAHASQDVTFTLSQRDLSIVDSTGQRYVPAGPVELTVGSTQPIALPNRSTPNAKSTKITITTNSPPLPN